MSKGLRWLARSDATKEAECEGDTPCKAPVYQACGRRATHPYPPYKGQEEYEDADDDEDKDLFPRETASFFVHVLGVESADEAEARVCVGAEV